MRKSKLLNDLEALEAIADLMIDKATAVKREAHKERLKLVGVSTPAARKGLSIKEKMHVLYLRRKTFWNKEPHSSKNSNVIKLM